MGTVGAKRGSLQEMCSGRWPHTMATNHRASDLAAIDGEASPYGVHRRPP